MRTSLRTGRATRPGLNLLHTAALLALAPAAVGVLLTAGDAAAQRSPAEFTWRTVANSADVIPGGDGRRFNSFNQPSVNKLGTVVLRARSKGGQGAGEPVRGIYARQMSASASARPLHVVFDNATEVPGPNNTPYQGALGSITEFPAFPRIGLDNGTVATRGQSKPVWTYTAADGSETRTGTSGIYAQRLGERVAGMAQLGAVPGFEHFGVPGAAPGTKFDQFPGSPAVADTHTVAFKGNYTDGVPKTGIFFRGFNPSGMASATQVIASSDTVIPGQLAGAVTFGSTAPPSASNRDVVFLGLDNEEMPTMGGIYRAPLATTPPLQALATIGGQVPGEQAGVGFTRLGEALSYDGRYVAFWGAWGDDARQITLQCAADGQSAVIAYCHAHYPQGHTVWVPKQQGFFVHDAISGRTTPAVKTGADFEDFVYWNFSGRPPGVGESEAEDPEPPRWRSTAFVATYGQGNSAQVAFKGRKPTVPATDGIYLVTAPSRLSTLKTVVETQSAATVLDPMAPAGALVTTVGIERDGLRRGWLAISASMLDPDTSESWAGVYVTRTSK